MKEKGATALRRYDMVIASGGNADKALWTALYLVGNRVCYFT